MGDATSYSATNLPLPRPFYPIFIISNTWNETLIKTWIWLWLLNWKKELELGILLRTYNRKKKSPCTKLNSAWTVAALFIKSESEVINKSTASDFHLLCMSTRNLSTNSWKRLNLFCKDDSRAKIDVRWKLSMQGAYDRRTQSSHNWQSVIGYETNISTLILADYDDVAP